MVAHPGAQGRADRIRPLNRPRPVKVEAGADGRPNTVYLSGRRYAVEEVLEVWRIDDEWWRKKSVSRRYFSLLLGVGRTVTVYQDTVSGRWYQQAY